MRRFLRLFRYVRDLESQIEELTLKLAEYESNAHTVAPLQSVNNTVSEHRRAAHQNPSPERFELGAWIMFQMKRRGITMAAIAAACNVTLVSVHTVVWGKRTSAHISKQIATSIGYSSWDEMVAAYEEARV